MIYNTESSYNYVDDYEWFDQFDDIIGPALPPFHWVAEPPVHGPCFPDIDF